MKKQKKHVAELGSYTSRVFIRDLCCWYINSEFRSSHQATFILIFQEALFRSSNTFFFPGERSVCSSNRSYFSGNPCLFVKHMPPCLFFCSNIIFFQKSRMPSNQISIFQEGSLCRTDISAIILADGFL